MIFLQKHNHNNGLSFIGKNQLKTIEQYLKKKNQKDTIYTVMTKSDYRSASKNIHLGINKETRSARSLLDPCGAVV
jgi:hypothetical protein